MKAALILLTGTISGAVAGAGAMLLAFPFLFPPPVVDEPPPAAAALMERSTVEPDPLLITVSSSEANRIRLGSFDSNSPGRDFLHWADGEVGIYRQGERFVLRLESNFVAGPGPDFYIYLNTRKIGDEDEFKADGERIKLTKLRSFRGGQNYVLPAEVDLAAVQSVTIWCERFSEFIANAVIAQGNA